MRMRGKQGTLGKRLAEQVRKQFYDPLVGDEVVLVEVDGQGLDLGAVLDPSYIAS